jgi:proteasome alpha subunit
MPYYVAPEQVMKDRAEYAQKGIARGRSLVATTYDDGIVMVAENPSRSLHKISEIYDRIAFGGVGKYNEYDQLRVAGVRHADTKGYAYSREDVDARSLANLYAQYLGNVFTHEMKPLEVEILVAELGEPGRPDQLYHIAYEGTWAAMPRPSPSGWPQPGSPAGTWPPRSGPPPRRWPARNGRWPAPISRWPCSARGTGDAPSAG